MLPGAPSLYYGDEAGMEGHKDPFNRRTYPWGREDKILLEHFRTLGYLRKNSPALRMGDIRFLTAEKGHIDFTRTWGEETLEIYVNLNDDPWEIPYGKVMMDRKARRVAPGWIRLDPGGFCLKAVSYTHLTLPTKA